MCTRNSKRHSRTPADSKHTERMHLSFFFSGISCWSLCYCFYIPKVTHEQLMTVWIILRILNDRLTKILIRNVPRFKWILYFTIWISRNKGERKMRERKISSIFCLSLWCPNSFSSNEWLFSMFKAIQTGNRKPKIYEKCSKSEETPKPTPNARELRWTKVVNSIKATAKMQIIYLPNKFT